MNTEHWTKAELRARLLAWYDANARALPWRVGPAERARGVRPDPYRVWLSEVMLQQTTVAVVRRYFARFTELWPRVEDLAAASEAQVMAEWAGLGYYARARNLHACARIVAEAGGRFPSTREGLEKLPGIGPYTAAAIAAIAHDAPEAVVDGNVERVMARLHAVEEPLPKAKPRLAAHAAALVSPHRPGDFAQAMMDLGATVCTPRAPACGRCPLAFACAARASGLARELPRRAAKTPKPRRRGIAYVARRAGDGAWLLERRPPRGLLGGTLGWPVSEWTEGDAPAPAPPLAAEWSDAGARVRHTFTHFHLELEVFVTLAAPGVEPRRGSFVPAEAFRAEALPSLMRKVHAVAREHPAIAAVS
ncbi:A/G-specific DNA-adenine glycosylase [Meinhardsimonia xiamenensis]|uniref:Adenine DNA glycosylase n=1 Tax=Meinhardsimonia xiamenensis TaxID=990712 RepID=A0A1G8YZZ7_9RHOB|nr:A/G-specific adenine glycosylase [Meinhardsimonia xiamenensis]PRX37488.1 A/G-specific DNA-adenine glycosylase [Meinhardsimonia xiamenensis]SDK07964.1 A/G-specific DNA-adenine glycosylase [Meinhardsimonia xiamenensis]